MHLRKALCACTLYFAWFCREKVHRHYPVDDADHDKHARVFLRVIGAMDGPTVDRIGKLLESAVYCLPQMVWALDEKEWHLPISYVRDKAVRRATLASELEKQGLKLRQRSRLCRCLALSPSSPFSISWGRYFFQVSWGLYSAWIQRTLLYSKTATSATICSLVWTFWSDGSLSLQCCISWPIQLATAPVGTEDECHIGSLYCCGSVPRDRIYHFKIWGACVCNIATLEVYPPCLDQQIWEQ